MGGFFVNFAVVHHWNTLGHSYDIGTQVRATQNEDKGSYYKRSRGIKTKGNLLLYLVIESGISWF